tara:strand:+ start:1598 stop:1909 length:312 start_codon:yes stop_codon:yes gene_type:complete
MINWTWEIPELNRETSDGFVYSAKYILYGRQTVGSITYVDSRGGTFSFLRPDSLTPYTDLTESVVAGWVESQLGVDKVSEIKKEIMKSFRDQQDLNVSTGKPW